MLEKTLCATFDFMKVKVSELSHHPLNSEVYKVDNVDDLIESINDIGLLEKLIVNPKYQVISGNRRLKALTQLNKEEVEVEMIDLKDSNEELKFLIHYNKHRVKSVSERLNEIKHLKNLYSIGQGKRSDLSKKGKSNYRKRISKELSMSENTLYKLLFIDKNSPELINEIDKGLFTISQAYRECKKQIDKEYSTQSTPLLEPSTNKINTNFSLYNKSSEILNELNDNSIDCIITSPPYFNKRVYTNKGELGQEKSVSEFVDNLVDHLKDYKRVLKDTGSFYLNIGDSYLDGELQLIPHRVSIKLIEKYGWILKHSIVWKKTNPLPSSSEKRLTNSYEYIFHFVKSKKYRFNKFGYPISQNTKPSTSPNYHSDNGVYSPYIPSPDGMRKQHDFLDDDIIQTSVSNNSFLEKYGIKKHPALFPSSIPLFCLLQSTVEGDVVLDPFMGSATTGVTSIRLNRKFVGYEINNEYYKLSLQRLNEI